MKLIECLEDISNQVEILSEFQIKHPKYQPIDLPDESYLQTANLSKELKRKFLSFHLRSFLYSAYYNSSLLTEPLVNGLNIRKGKRPAKNNTIMGVDPIFYKEIHERNSGKGFFDPGWQVLQKEMGKVKIVRKGELNLYVDPQRHLNLEESEFDVGANVAVLLPKNRFMPGFYVAVGDAGHQSSQELIVRIYMNLTSEGAPTMMQAITSMLNSRQVPFTFKVLFNPNEYDRYDAGVLYFNQQYFETVHSMLYKIYTENCVYFKAEVPLFTKALAPGLSLAEEPLIKFSLEESFGLNRCQIVANGLIEAWEKGINSVEEKVDIILNQFKLLGVDPVKPYLNPNSEDIYALLNLNQMIK